MCFQKQIEMVKLTSCCKRIWPLYFKGGRGHNSLINLFCPMGKSTWIQCWSAAQCASPRGSAVLGCVGCAAPPSGSGRACGSRSPRTADGTSPAALPATYTPANGLTHSIVWYLASVVFGTKGKQEGPEGPGTLTWDRRLLRVPFIHCFMYNRRHLGGLNLNAIVLKFKRNVFKRIFYDLTWWPSFIFIYHTHIQTWPRYCQNKHSDQVS